MATRSLPDNPDLGQLRNQARDLLKAVRAGDRRALALVAEHHPRADVRGFALHQAHLVVARRHGFGSWPQLTRHLAIIRARSWSFTEDAAAPDPAAGFLRLACLNYATDSSDRRASARALLAAHPALPGADLAVAAACADVAAVRRHLSTDPGAAGRRCGPYGWSPLMYQTYARHDPSIGRDATLTTARLLLDAGADPGDGRFFGGLPTPFTLLTGLFADHTPERPEHPWAVPGAAGGAPGGPGRDRRRRRPGDVPWTVLADPEGHEFCVLAVA